MITRIAAALLLGPLFFLVLTVFDLPYLVFMIGGIAVIASVELLVATLKKPPTDLLALTMFAAGAIPLGTAYFSGEDTSRWVSIALIISLFLVGVIQYGKPKAPTFETILICYFGGIIYPTLITSLIILRQMDHGGLMILFPVLLSFGGDTGAYFVGMSMGKHRGITKVSPNKSLEGYIGGIVFGMLTMLAYGIYLQNSWNFDVKLEIMALYGFVGAIATSLGDLSFSLIKREKEIKDFGNSIPGHGGMLDRFDSLGFCAPVILFLLETIPAI
ncbi:MAG: phosphatidate cytidylyltransferase [Eubacteriales bacterium]